MNLKKIKCVIVDFDATLYSNGDWSREPEFFGKYLVDRNILPEIPGWEEKLDFLLEKYPTFHIIKSIFAYLHDNGIDDLDFRKFNNEHICEIRGKDTVFIKPKIIAEIAKHYPIYIVSDSSVPYIEKYLKFAKIDKKLFSGIYENEYNDETYSKISIMKRVLNESGVKPNEVVMIGDSEMSDIQPGKLLGFQTKLVKSVYDTEEILQNLVNLKSSTTI